MLPSLGHAMASELYCQEQVLLTGKVCQLATCGTKSAGIDNPLPGPATFPFLDVSPSRGATNAQFQQPTPALGPAGGRPEVRIPPRTSTTMVRLGAEDQIRRASYYGGCGNVPSMLAP